MYKNTFLFGSKITAKDFFTPEKGYGFIDPHKIPGKTMSEQSIFSGGWNLMDCENTKWDNVITTGNTGVTLTKDKFVMIFKVLVPNDGSYQITLKSHSDDKSITNMTIFSGRRNLVERNISIKKGECYTKTFFTYVAPYIPAMTSIPSDEKAVYISLTGENATFSEITIEEKAAPTVFIAGDSTLTDQNASYPYYPIKSCAGWAQNLLSYFESVAVCNQAHSGMTTNCFRDDGHWDIVRKHIKPGDIVILQFGHNDQKRRNLRPFGGYLDNLRWYCREIKELGATPIIVSPISRIPMKDKNSFYSLLSDYAHACKKAAKECQVPFVDLHTLTFHYLCRYHEVASDYFMPGDITHTNDYGAELIAAFFVSELLRQDIQPLSSWLVHIERNAFLPENKEFPQQNKASAIPQIEIPYLDIAGIPEYEDMKQALQKGILDPCVMYLHPTASMPRAQFLMVFLKALRIAGTRPYTGFYCDLSYDEWDSSFAQTCINENLIDEKTTPNHYFRPDDDLTFAEYASFLIRGLEKEQDRRKMIALNDCFQKAKALKLIPCDCMENDAITRATCYQGLVRLMELLDTSSKALPSDAELHPVG